MATDYSIKTPISLKTIAWIAGLLEGEGSFQYVKGAVIALGMTDADVVSHFGLITEKAAQVYRKRTPNRKPIWVVRLNGARAVAWMMTLYPLMGIRRRAQIATALSQWLQAPGFPKARTGSISSAICHPNRPRVSRGLCESCYDCHVRYPRAQCHPRRRMKENGLCTICLRWELISPPVQSDSPCHPERSRFALGFCRPCYNRWYHYHHRRQPPM